MRRASLLALVFMLGFVCGLESFPLVNRKLNAWHDQRLRAKYLLKEAPEIEAETLTGSTWRLSEERGKVLVIEFWATWCTPCVASLPVLENIHKRHGDRADFRIVAISIDEDQRAVKEFVELHKLPWPVILDPPVDGRSRVFDRYRVPGIPSLWVIDKTGKVVAMNTYYSDLPAIIEPLLK